MPASLPVVVALVLAGLLFLQLWAREVDYPLRVTSDTPTYLALIPDMAERPFSAQSPFLPHGNVETSHADPYMQALALVWRAVAPKDETHDPVALSRLLALIGIGVSAFVLLALFLYVRRLAGDRAAWISIPVVLGLFGPAHVIWASDLTLHGFLYASFYPQNVALGLMLLTLIVLERRTHVSLAGATLLACATMLVHPFTGLLLCMLTLAWSWRLAARGELNYLHGPVALTGAFVLGLSWPGYSLDKALGETGVSGYAIVGLCSLAPIAFRMTLPTQAGSRAGLALRNLVARLDSRSMEVRFAICGAVAVVVLAVWEYLLTTQSPSALSRVNRLSVYWVEDRWRWPLLFSAGAVGVVGLARLARRGQIVPAVWFFGCFALGTAGAVGAPIPLWYRLLLFCQIPLAAGVAVVVAETVSAWSRQLIAVTFAFALVFKVVTLVAIPPTLTYFGTGIQETYALGSAIRNGPGLVATDPTTAYFIPGATGHRVLTVTKAHVGSRAELAASERGYRLLHQYYSGGASWWTAAQRMWRLGVRYIVVEKHTSLAPETLEDFSTGPTPFIWTRSERRQLGNYFYENNRIGTILYDSFGYVVYRLDPAKLFLHSVGSGDEGRAARPSARRHRRDVQEGDA